MSARLWWVSVGGNPGEPAQVVTEDGKRTAFTIGCPDGIVLGRGSGVKLLAPMQACEEAVDDARFERERRAWVRKVEADRARGIFHGYRRFDGEERS